MARAVRFRKGGARYARSSELSHLFDIDTVPGAPGDLSSSHVRIEKRGAFAMNAKHQAWFRSGIGLLTSLAMAIVSLATVLPAAAGENSMPSEPPEYVSVPAQVSIEPPASPATVQATLPISLP